MAEQLHLREKVEALISMYSTPASDVAWVMGMTTELMWQVIEKANANRAPQPTGMSGVLAHRMAQFYGIQPKTLIVGSAEDVQAAADAARDDSLASRLDDGLIDPYALRRELCGDL